MNKYLKYLLVLILIGIIVVIAMQFFAPTIGNVSQTVDPCGPCLCGSPECDWNCSSPNQCNDAWRNGLPTGKLVVIIPKTVVVGEDNSSGVGFAYSPANYSRDEISQITQQYLQDLNLREDEVHIIKFDVIMDTKGHPRIDGPFHSLGNGSTGFLHIAPDKLTVWKIRLQSDELVLGGLHDFRVRFLYHAQQRYSYCSEFCEALGIPFLEPSENVKVRIKSTFAENIHYLENYWSSMISRYWFLEPIFYFLLLVLVVFLVEIVRKRSSNRTPE